MFPFVARYLGAALPTQSCAPLQKSHIFINLAQNGLDVRVLYYISKSDLAISKTSRPNIIKIKFNDSFV